MSKRVIFNLFVAASLALSTVMSVVLYRDVQGVDIPKDDLFGIISSPLILIIVVAAFVNFPAKFEKNSKKLTLSQGKLATKNKPVPHDPQGLRFLTYGVAMMLLSVGFGLLVRALYLPALKSPKILILTFSILSLVAFAALMIVTEIKLKRNDSRFQ